MGTAVTQVLKKSDQSRSLAAEAESPRPLGDAILSLVSLPAREELQKHTETAPRPLTDNEALALKETQARLRKALTEIDYRLGFGSQPVTKEELQYKFKSRGDFGEKCFDHVMSSILSGGLGTLLGMIPASIFTRSSGEGISLALGIGLGSMIVSNGIQFWRNAYHGYAIAKKEVFHNEGAPCAGLLDFSMNPLVRLKALFYRGPSSEAARDYDRKYSETAASDLPRNRKAEKNEAAKDALRLAREQVEAELKLVNSRLQRWQCRGYIEEAAGMLKELVSRLSIPESADADFLEETAARTTELKNALSEFKKDRQATVATTLPAMKYFKHIITLLESNDVDQRITAGFFVGFNEALDDRLRLIKLAQGRFANKNFEETEELVP